MKAGINGIQVEGTPEEIAQLINLLYPLHTATIDKDKFVWTKQPDTVTSATWNGPISNEGKAQE